MSFNLLAGLNPGPLKLPDVNSYLPKKNTPAPAPVVSAPSMGVKAVSPTTNVKKPSTTLPAAQKAPLAAQTIATPNVDTNYQLRAGESPTQYNARVASYNASKGGSANSASSTPTAPPAPPQPTFPGLVGQQILAAQGLQNQAGNVNKTAEQIGQQGQVTPEEQAAKNKLAALPGIEGSVAANIENHPSDLAFQMGREAVAGRNLEAMRQSLADQSSAYATTRQANTTAYTGEANAQNAAGGLLNSAGGLYNSAASQSQPQLAGFNQQSFNPITNTFGSGSNGTGALASLPQEAQNAVNSYAQQVRSGSMTRPDAEARLSAYGVAGTNALNEVLGTGFNTNASNASAATTATGQQIQAAIAPANQALEALQNAFNNLPAIQQTGIPILNQFAQNTAMSTGLGRQQASDFQGALQEARSRIDAALVGSIGVNAAAAQASALLPDNMIPSELPGKIAAAKQYLQNQLNSYTSSGQQPNVNQNGSIWNF